MKRLFLLGCVALFLFSACQTSTDETMISSESTPDRDSIRISRSDLTYPRKSFAYTFPNTDKVNLHYSDAVNRYYVNGEKKLFELEAITYSNRDDKGVMRLEGVLEIATLNHLTNDQTHQPILLTLHQDQNVYQQDINHQTHQLLLAEVLDMTCTTEHVLFLKKDGSVWGMGKNGAGQAAPKDASNWVEAPAQITLPARAKSIAGAQDVSLALLEDGTLYGWGNNDSSIFQSEETAVREPLQLRSSVESFSVTYEYLLGGRAVNVTFRESDGSVWGLGAVFGTEPVKLKPELGRLSIPDNTSLDEYYRLASQRTWAEGAQYTGKSEGYYIDDKGNLYHRSGSDVKLLAQDVEEVSTEPYCYRTKSGEVYYFANTNGDLTPAIKVTDQAVDITQTELGLLIRKQDDSVWQIRIGPMAEKPVGEAKKILDDVLYLPESGSNLLQSTYTGYALTKDHSLYAWGVSHDGGLGNGTGLDMEDRTKGPQGIGLVDKVKVMDNVLYGESLSRSPETSNEMNLSFGIVKLDGTVEAWGNLLPNVPTSLLPAGTHNPVFLK